MAQSYTQTDTVMACVKAAFCAAGVDNNATDLLRQASVGGAQGVTEVSAGVNASGGDERAAWFECVIPAGTSWDAGNWVVRFNLTTANNKVTWDAVYICRVSSGCVNQATIGSSTGLGVSMMTAGVQSVVVSGSAQTPGVGDKVIVVLLFDNADTMFAQTMGITPSENIDSPFTVVLTESFTKTADARVLAEQAFTRTADAEITAVSTQSFTKTADARTLNIAYLQEYRPVQTDGAAVCAAETFCSGMPLNTDQDLRKAVARGTAGVTEVTTTLDAGATDFAAIWFEMDHPANVELVDGAWNVPINVTTPNELISLEDIFICSIGSVGCMTLDTIGSRTGIGRAMKPGVHNFRVSTSPSFILGDRIMVILGFTNLIAGPQAFGWTPDQTFSTNLIVPLTSDARILAVQAFTRTSDARVRSTLSMVRTSDAEITAVSTPSFTKTADARILNLVELTRTSDARLLAMQELTRTSDARVLVEQAFTRTSDARLLAIQEFTRSSDARILTVQAFTRTSDARILAVQEFSKTADAAILAVVEFTRTSDARVQALVEFTKTSDAQIGGVTTQSFTRTSDARVRAEQELTRTSDARILSISEFTRTSDARILRTSEFTRTSDARVLAIVEFTKASNARLLSTVDFTRASDARLLGIIDFTKGSDARVLGTVDFTRTSDAEISTATVETFTRTSDARILGTTEFLRTSDAQISADGVVVGRPPTDGRAILLST